MKCAEESEVNDDFSKYEAMRDARATREDVCRAAKKDGVDSITMFRLIRRVFNLSFPEAKEVILRAEGVANSLDEHEGRIADEIERMTKSQVHVCRVDTPEGTKDYVTLIPPEVAFSQGLAAEAIVGVLLRPVEEGEQITSEIFARNRAFVDFMHQVIARDGPHQPGCVAEAKRLGEGLVCITDQRTPTPEGPVPSEDIIGVFKVNAGAVSPESYHPNPNHLILSGRGFFRLEPGLQWCLLRALTNLNESKGE